MGLMPKLMGISYFNAAEKGAREAADELGIDLDFDGPAVDSAEEQVKMIDRWIAQGYDMIAVAANDPELIAPALRRAKQAGITVLTWDADANPQASRPRDVRQSGPDRRDRHHAGRYPGRGPARPGQDRDRDRIGHVAQSKCLDEGHAGADRRKVSASSNCSKRWSATKTSPRPIGCRAT